MIKTIIIALLALTLTNCAQNTYKVKQEAKEKGRVLNQVPQWYIDAKVDKPRATTGDIINYTVTLKHDMDLKPSMPDFSVIDGFDVLESLASKPNTIEDQIEQKYIVKLRADQTGLFTIPPIEISFEVIKNVTGKVIPGKMRTPEVTIEVASVLRLQGEPVDIRDIKGLVEVDRNWTSWLYA